MAYSTHSPQIKQTQWPGKSPSNGPDCGPARLCGISRGRGNKRASEGSGMHIDPNECHPAMDYAEHERTYKLFTKLTLVTIVGVAALMAFLYIFVV
jgi:aa3 type cytochrome c oxidase subunit IV